MKKEKVKNGMARSEEPCKSPEHDQTKPDPAPPDPAERETVAHRKEMMPLRCKARQDNSQNNITQRRAR